MQVNRNLLAVMAFAVLITGVKANAREMEMERLFKTDFVGFEPPDSVAVKAGAVQQTISEVEFDEVWKAALAVLMQRSVIVRASKESGVIVAMDIPQGTGALVSGFPTAIFLERRGPLQTTVFCNWPEAFYRAAGGKSPPIVTIGGYSKQRLGRLFLDKVVNQSLSKERWRYLER